MSETQVDKDFASVVLAREIGAIELFILTGVVLLGAGLAMWFWPPRLPSAPDFLSLEISELQLWVRADQAEIVLEPRGSALKATESEMALWVESQHELGPVLFQVHGRLDRVTVRSGGKTEEFEPSSAQGVARRFFLEWQPEKPRRSPERPGFFYQLDLSLSGASTDPMADDGTTIALIGSRAYLDRDLYGVNWLGCGAPKTVLAGEEFQVLAHMKNTSKHAWPHQGNDRIQLAARWRNSREEAGPRADIRATVEAGDETARWLLVRALDRPGRHVLDMDLFHEPVAWFSSRGAPTCEVEILVH